MAVLHAKLTDLTTVVGYRAVVRVIPERSSRDISKRVCTQLIVHVIMIIIISKRELKFMFAICHRPSVCRLSSVSSVTFVRPTQMIEIFGNVSTP